MTGFGECKDIDPCDGSFVYCENGDILIVTIRNTVRISLTNSMKHNFSITSNYRGSFRFTPEKKMNLKHAS